MARCVSGIECCGREAPHRSTFNTALGGGQALKRVCVLSSVVALPTFVPTNQEETSTEDPWFPATRAGAGWRSAGGRRNFGDEKRRLSNCCRGRGKRWMRRPRPAPPGGKASFEAIPNFVSGRVFNRLTASFGTKQGPGGYPGAGGPARRGPSEGGPRCPGDRAVLSIAYYLRLLCQRVLTESVIF